MYGAVLKFGTTSSGHDEPEMCFALDFEAAMMFPLDLRGCWWKKGSHNPLELYRALPLHYHWSFLLLAHEGSLLVWVLGTAHPFEMIIVQFPGTALPLGFGTGVLKGFSVLHRSILLGSCWCPQRAVTDLTAGAEGPIAASTVGARGRSSVTALTPSNVVRNPPSPLLLLLPNQPAMKEREVCGKALPPLKAPAPSANQCREK